MKIKILLGYIFIILGLVWSILDKTFCKSLCNICSYEELSPCFFLFLFVGIIFIVDGLALIYPEKGKRKKKVLKLVLKVNYV